MHYCVVPEEVKNKIEWDEKRRQATIEEKNSWAGWCVLKINGGDIPATQESDSRDYNVEHNLGSLVSPYLMKISRG